MKLRSLRETDLAELTKFAAALADEKKRDPDLGVVSFEQRPTMAEQSEFLRHTIAGVESGDVVDVAAFDGKAVVGNCDITRRKPTEVSRSGVLGIVLAEGYRGRGLGERMMRRALWEARRVGISLVELSVFGTNARAIRLYTKLGFKNVGTVPRKIRRAGRTFD